MLLLGTSSIEENGVRDFKFILLLEKILKYMKQSLQHTLHKAVKDNNT
jgi:hypothetical protein